MSFEDIFAVSGAILASIGGGVAIVFGFSNWLGKVWANRLMTKEKAEYAQELESFRNRLTQDTESYKIKLKKSELIFEKEFIAASELVAFIRGLLPAYRSEEMDWDDAYNDIASKLENIEAKLDEFLSKHGAVLGSKLLISLRNAVPWQGRVSF